MRKREKGAVTVFCIIVLFSIVLLGGLFIDASRILLARQMVRSSMNSAARSALSYYSTELVGDFGLYGVTEEDAKTQFERYFINNLTLSQNDGFHLYDFEIGENPTTVTVSEPLSDQEAFTDQVSEYSKYSAGINLTVGVINKVSMLFGQDGAAQKSMDATKQAQDAFDQLKQDAKSFGSTITKTLKDNVKKTASDAGDKLISDIKNGVQQEALDFGEDALNALMDDANSQVDGMQADKNTYEEKSEQANQQMNDAGTSMTDQEYYNKETGKWETAQENGTVEQTEPSGSTPGDQAEQIIGNAQTEINAAQDRIDSNMAAIKTKAAQAQELQARLETFEGELAELNAQVAACQQTYDNTLAAMLGQQEKSLEELNARITKAENELNLLKELQGGKMPDNIEEADRARFEELQRDPERLEQAVKDAETTLEELRSQRNQVQMGNIGEIADKLKQDKAALDQAKRALDEKQTEYDQTEQNFNNLLSEIQGLYDDMAMAEDKTITGDISYDLEVDQDKQNESSNIFTNAWNTMMETLGEIPAELGKNAQYVDGSTGQTGISRPADMGSGLGVITELMDTCQAITEIFTNENALLERCYFVEYALDKYTFLVSQSNRPAHHFQIGEVEYIIDGNDIQGINIGTVVGKIMTLRLVINFVDDLIHTQSPEPVSRVVLALGRALLDTAEDMADLLLKGECGLCPSFDKVKLTYSDHLRLELLLSSNERMAERMGIMIDRTMDNKGSEHIDQLYTRIDATAEVKIDLIMLTLPMFGEIMPGQDVIQDGQFTIRETVSMGY